MTGWKALRWNGHTSKKDGSEVPVLLSLNHLKDSEGNLTGYLGVAFDNSVRKSTEVLLQWNEHLLQLMSDSSPFGFMVTDQETGRILYFNERFFQMWNLTDVEDKIRNNDIRFRSIVRAIRPMIASSSKYSFLNGVKPDFTTTDVIREEMYLTDGRTIGVFLTRIRGEHGEYQGHFYIFEDISEQKMNEKETAVTECSLRISSSCCHYHRSERIYNVGKSCLYRTHRLFCGRGHRTS